MYIRKVLGITMNRTLVLTFVFVPVSFTGRVGSTSKVKNRSTINDNISVSTSANSRHAVDNGETQNLI